MNKDKLSWFLNKFFFIHPLAVILIFIINSYDLVKFNDSVSDIEILISIGFTLIFVLLSYALFKRLLKDKYKAAVLTSILSVFCLFYVYISVLVYSFQFVQTIIGSIFYDHRSTTLILFFLCSFTLLAVYLRKSNANYVKFTWFLNVLSIIFLSMMITHSVKTGSSHITLSNNDYITKKNDDNRPPDIYYIILDSYTGNNSLNKYWNFTNSEFADYLKKTGFYIANSSSNYNLTPFSLSSSLNMSYLDFDRNIRISKKHYKETFELVKSSKLVNFLASNGYKIINYSFFDVFNQPKFFDDHFFLRDRFFSRSIFSNIYPIVTGIKEQDEISHLQTDNLNILDKIKELKLDNSKPSFVYAHLLLPHFPYFFDHNGKKMSLQYADDAGNQTKYLEQLRYTNKIISECIESILRNSKSLPVIIIQGDHGFRYLKGREQLAESFTILNAYYFPDKTYSTLYDSISPVNSFRVVLNKYFNTNLPLLKDSSINVLPKEVLSEH